MNKYLSLLKTDIKNIYKVPINLYLVFSPIMYILMFGYLVPLMMTKVGANDQASMDMTANILVPMILGLGSFISAFLFGLLLLEDKDSNSIKGVAVSPVGLKGFLIYKSIYVYILGFIGTFITIYGLVLVGSEFYTGLNNLDNVLVKSLIVSVSVSFVAPVCGLLIGLAKNKVAGFMVGKSLALILFIPLIVLLPTFQGPLQYVLGIFPFFCPIKAMMNETLYVGGHLLLTNDANLSFMTYNIIGIVTGIIFTAIMIKLFIKTLKL